MRFGLKLLLAMVSVILVVIILSLFASERRMQAAYRDALLGVLRSDITQVFSLQQARLDAVSERCAVVAESPRLIATLESEDPSIIYATTEDELREFLETGTTGPEAAFLAVANADGSLIPDPQGGNVPWSDAIQSLVQEATDASLEKLQSMAYMLHEDTVYEIVVSRMIDAYDDEVVGMLIIGFPYVQPTTIQGPDGDSILSGLLIQGQLLGFPAETAGHDLIAGMAIEPGASDGLEVELEDGPWLLLSQGLSDPDFGPQVRSVSLATLAPAIAAQRAIMLMVLAAGGIAVIIGIGASWLLARGLVRPVNDLVAGTHEIEHGNYEYRVPIRSRDELGTLAGAFNRMSGGLAQRDKYRNVLDVVSDAEVAEQLLSGELVLGGETRELGVLFCDIRGFTAMTEPMTPNAVIEMLNEHMTVLTQVVHRHNGVVDKYVGDLIMALFGAPRAMGNDVTNMARCALEMIEARDQLNQRSDSPIEMGIGLAWGEAVAGCMGSQERLNYTVLGKRVNLAARLCGRADSMSVLIDEDTRRLLGDDVQCTPLEPVELKGFSNPVPVFELKSLNVEHAS